MDSPEHKKKDVIRYFEMEHGEATVEHAERVASERIYGDRHDVWDIRSTDGRWWVITNPTNLYRQDDFHSMDYVLSFHVGLMARMMDRHSREANVGDEERGRLLDTWRKYEQAAEALNTADEAEEFQAVGMRCRQALLSFVESAASEEMVPSGVEAPKRGDFVHWSENVANTVAAGSSAATFRSYLKKTSKATWDLVNWLTHAADATRFDGEAAIGATVHCLEAYSGALFRHEKGVPDRCPGCSSYQLDSDYRDEIGEDGAYLTICDSCGWESDYRLVEPPHREVGRKNTNASSRP